MAAEAHGHAHPRLAHHFESMPKQAHAARLGMWLFLATEILLFGALFCGYTVYRHFFPEGFAAASGLLNKPMALSDTIDLVTSSFTRAMAIHFAREQKVKGATGLLVVTIMLGLG